MSSAGVVVVGAGIIGCAIARLLARQGHAVRLLESRTIGGGATHASAGVLAPYIEGHDSSTLCALGQRSLDLYPRFIADVGAETGTSLLFERHGTIEVAFDTVSATRLQRAGEALRAAGIDAEWVDAAMLARLEPVVSRGVRGALSVPRHGFVGVTALTTALESSAARNGARVETGVRVTRIGRGVSGRVSVTTNRGTIEADTVVLASGSWSSQVAIDGVPDVPVRPIRGQLLQLALPTRRLTRVVWGPHCYLVPWPDGSVLVGATVEDVGFDERSTVDGVTRLLEAATALVPELATATFAGVRVGLRPAGPDELPIVGRSSALPGLVYASGHFRNGVLLAPLTAELVAQIVAGDERDPALAFLLPRRAGAL